MVRIDDPLLKTSQLPYAEKCASVGMEVIVPKSEMHVGSIFGWNGAAANLYNVFPKYNGAKPIFNWEGKCKGAPCAFFMTVNGNGDVACGGMQPSGNNKTGLRIYRQADGCGVEGSWKDNSVDTVAIQGWVICSTNDC